MKFTGGLGLPSPEYYKDVSTLQVYLNSMKGMFSLLHPENSVSVSDDISESVLELEKKIASISLPKSELQDPNATYNPFTFGSLLQLSPKFDWNSYWKIRLPESEFPNSTKGDGLIVLETPKFFSDLSNLLTTTPSKTWEQYFQVRFNFLHQVHMLSFSFIFSFDPLSNFSYRV